MEKKKTYVQVAKATNNNVKFYSNELESIIEQHEALLATLNNSEQIAEFAKETYAHTLFLIENIESVQYHLRCDYLNFAVLCCLKILNVPKNLRLHRNAYSQLEKLYNELYILYDKVI